VTQQSSMDILIFHVPHAIEGRFVKGFVGGHGG
jgi:hypothetical protein